MSLQKSEPKNKLNDFNGLHGYTTGSIPVSPTISIKIKNIRSNNELACKQLKLLGCFYYPCLKRNYLVLRAYLKICQKYPPQRIKVSCKCLVRISNIHSHKLNGVNGLYLFKWTCFTVNLS